jgi:hypothetical protein
VWFDIPHLLKAVSPTKSFRINVSSPATTLLKPKIGAQINGYEVLVASASSAFGVRGVDIDISGKNLFETKICHAVQFRVWLEQGKRSQWNVFTP